MKTADFNENLQFLMKTAEFGENHSFWADLS